MLSLLTLLLLPLGLANAIPLLSSNPPTTPTCTQPNLSSDPTKWSTRDYIFNHLSNPTNPTPIFWSGRYKGASVASNAVTCSTKIAGGHAATISMDMCVLGGFTMPNVSTTAGNDLWSYASEVWAKRVKGDAYTVVGDALVTSTWFDVEFPALRANRDVGIVVSLDPGTCQERCFWYCQNPSDYCHVSAPSSV